MAFDRPKTEDIEKLFSRMDSAKKTGSFPARFPCRTMSRGKIC